MFKKGQKLIYKDGGCLVEVLSVSDFTGEGEHMSVRDLETDDEIVVTGDEYHKYRSTTCCACGKDLEDYQQKNFCNGDVCMLGILIGNDN